MSSYPHRQLTRQTLAGLLVCLLVLLRVVWLDADAYPGLSWNSALVTDEAFYCHDARNLLLTGSSQVSGDNFHNALIMPLLHAAQVSVFRVFGFGLTQSRSLSVALSLVTLAVFYAACRRGFGARVGLLALILLGLDHINLLFNRMGLMDTPAQLFLALCFYAFVRAFPTPPLSASLCAPADSEKRKDETEGADAASRQISGQAGWLFISGLALALGYATRGLSALLLPVPLALCWRAGSRRLMSQNDPDRNSGSRNDERGNDGAEEIGDSGRTVSWRSRNLRPLLWLLSGLSAGLIGYLVVWYLPNRTQLQTVNHFYVGQQLLPHSLDAVQHNIGHSLFGNDRGFSAYLFRHSPVQWMLTLAWLLTWRIRARQKASSSLPDDRFERLPALFLALWLLIILIVYALVRYSPPRYYVLFYPALAGLTALALVDLRAVFSALWESKGARVLWGTYGVYHLAEALLRHRSLAADALLYSLTVVAGLLLPLLPAALPALSGRIFRRVSWQAVLLSAWALINAGWLGDWAAHIAYTQRDADLWLGRNLPAQAVIIGDAAPGLTLRNHYTAINVIPGLCNDKQPLEPFADRPRYVILFESPTPMRWWQERYPQWITPTHRIRRFVLLGKFRLALYEIR